MQISIVTGEQFDWSSMARLSALTNDWTYGDADFDALQMAFGDGFKCVAARDQNGEFLGFVCGLEADPNMAFVACFYVDEKARGQNVGVRVFEQLTKKLGDRNVWLYSAPAMSPRYRDKFGFKFFDENSIEELIFTGLAPKSLTTSQRNQDISLSLAEIKDFSDIKQFDAEISNGIQRDGWIKHWLLGHKNGVCILARNRNKTLLGYTFLRTIGQNLAVVGPLYADDAKTAAELLSKLLQAAPNLGKQTRVHIMTAKSKTESLNSVVGEVCSWEKFEFGRPNPVQYTKQVWKTNMDKMFALADLSISPW